MKLCRMTLLVLLLVLVSLGLASADYYAGLATVNGEPVAITLDLQDQAIRGAALYNGQALQIVGELSEAREATLAILDGKGITLATLSAWEPPFRLFGILFPYDATPRWLYLKGAMGPDGTPFEASGTLWRWYTP